MDSIKQAQLDMRTAYYFGIPGIIASGTAWLVAGLVAIFVTPVNGIATLIFGGTLIFPVSVLLCKLIGRSGKHDKSNPLASLAIEGTFWMLLSIPIAVGAAFYRLEWFFPAMILVIGGRYLTFKTLYGMSIYWAFGLTLAICGVATAMAQVSVAVGALVGGSVEYLFALVIFVLAKRKQFDALQTA